jgi:hypothetical protein
MKSFDHFFYPLRRKEHPAMGFHDKELSQIAGFFRMRDGESV